MDVKNRIAAVIRMCQQSYWTFPTISVSQVEDGNFIVVLIGNSTIATPRPCIDLRCKVLMMTESDIFDRILNRDAILASLFTKAIVLKDELQIMWLIIQSIPTYYKSRQSGFYGGDVEVTFHNVNSPHLFISKTFIPFMEIAKTYLSKCPLIFSSQMCNGKMDVSAVFFGVKHDFDFIGLKKCLIRRVSELYLHSISVCKHNSCQVIADYPVGMLQQVSEQFIILYSNTEDNNDTVIRTIVDLYINTMLKFTDSLTECRIINRQILDKMLPNSLSSISAEFLLHEDIVNVMEGIKREYAKQFENNKKILFNLISSSVKKYQFIANSVKRVNTYFAYQKLNLLENIYSDIFSASMMHPYYIAFIPFCINEVLKYEI